MELQAKFELGESFAFVGHCDGPLLLVANKLQSNSGKQNVTVDDVEL